MRELCGPALAIVAVLAGCRQVSEPIVAPPEPPRLTLTGVVFDTLFHVPLEGAQVSARDTSIRTGTDGSFRLSVPADLVSLGISAPGYENATYVLERPIRLSRAYTLRPLRTVVRSCEILDTEIHAVVTDLQGRKTVDRREGSYLALSASGQDSYIAGISWDWQVADSLTWRVSVYNLPTRPDRATMTVSDVEGNGSSLNCVRPLTGQDAGGEYGAGGI